MSACHIQSDAISTGNFFSRFWYPALKTAHSYPLVHTTDRDVETVGQGGCTPLSPQILRDQLTLSQPGGANYAPHISTRPPPHFQTFRHPCYTVCNLSPKLEVSAEGAKS